MLPIRSIRKIDMIEFTAAARIGVIFERPVARRSTVAQAGNSRPSLLDSLDRACLAWFDRSYGVEQSMTAAWSKMRCIDEDRALYDR